MIKRYKIENRLIIPSETENPAIWVVISPTEDERKWLVENFSLDEHDFNSAFDPEEPARMEFEPDHMALIFKRPKNYSSKDHFMFKVTSMGLFLFKDKLLLALSEDINMFSGKYFKQVSGIREIFLKLIYNSIFHFMEHLKVINMIAEEIETKITHSMENRHLLNLFTLEKSLVYYLNAINANSYVIDRLKHNTEKVGLSQKSVEFLDDIIIENNQCYRQAEIYSNIFASLVGARASIVANNLNILMKNLNAIVIAIAVPSFFAGVGGMSEIASITGIHNPRAAYPAFMALMIAVGIAIFLTIKRLEKH
ncbi:MAG: divalent metal ion transporter [Elusimicrobia bacterium CG_4_10_14_0_2_um_filter_56_8]|nr:MAG: divalent metal ion transporter [Elusimicrobia bacterium CG1_02_56_21]PJA15214.1 MAG: divalent metal ion transporter [Elusimicrobia bacterium CG_4_10_14_0_2_um_filter_56_8]